MLETEGLAGPCEVLGLVAGAVVGHHPCDHDAQAVVIGDCGLEKATALTAFSSGKMSVKAMREASSIETWTYSQPTPRELL